MKYISEADLRAYLINDGCDDGCGYLDERDIPSLPWIELDATDDDVLDKIWNEISKELLTYSIDVENMGDSAQKIRISLGIVRKIIDKYREEQE